MTNTTSPTHALLTAPLAQPKRPRKASALLLGTALGAIVGMGYGRGAYAQTILSGTNTTTQTLTGPGEFVTEEGFSVDTSGSDGNGITITTPSGQTGDTVFNDQNGSVIAGADDGIKAFSDGTGALSITTSAVIEAGNDGIEAVNNNSSGSGYLSVTANGTVTGGSNPGHAGIVARNYSTGDLTISTAKVDGSGGASGIRAVNKTGGSVEISSTGLVEGSQTGISALNEAQNTVDLIIQSADVYGLGVDSGQGVAPGGIAAENQGTGALSITSSGNVEDTAFSGIFARASGVGASDATDLADNSLEGVSLAINANNVTGTTTGIDAENRGSGTMTITTTGLVKGIAEEGIKARNEAPETQGLIVDAHDVESGETGIEAYNEGNGSLTVYANTVTAGEIGIDAENKGSGALTIKTTGAVIGDEADAEQEGIRADNKSAGTDLTIEATTVTGYVGIDAKSYGSG